MSTERWPLPKNWQWTEASKVARIVGGGTPPTGDPANFDSDNGVPWITPADLTGYAGTYISRGRRNISQKGLAVSGAQVLPAGSVLFSSRAPIGYCAIAANPISTNQGFKSLVLKQGLLPEFVRYYLLSSKEFAESLASGTTFKELSAARMANMPIPVAPEPEQRRIVEKLDRVLATSRTAREELDRIPKLVERYKQAVLEKVFSGATSASIGKPEPLSKMIDSTFYGPRVSNEAYVQNGVPTLRTTDIGSWGRLNLHDPPRVAVSDDEFVRWSFQDQDLMVTRTGATIGKCALYESIIGPALPSAYLIRVRLKLDRVYGRYALLFLLSPEGQRQLLAGRTTVAQPNINAKAIGSVKIPLSSLHTQRKVVADIEVAFSRIDLVTKEHDRADKLLKRLDRAVLGTALSGGLKFDLKS